MSNSLREQNDCEYANYKVSTVNAPGLILENSLLKLHKTGKRISPVINSRRPLNYETHKLLN